MDSTPVVAPTGFRPVTDELLKEAAQRIVDALAPERVILFGSYAQGTPTPDSDIDLLVVMKTEERPSERRRAVSRLFGERPCPMDIVVRTPREVRQSMERVDPFIREVLERGRVLYERPTGEPGVGRNGGDRPQSHTRLGPPSPGPPAGGCLLSLSAVCREVPQAGA